MLQDIFERTPSFAILFSLLAQREIVCFSHRTCFRRAAFEYCEAHGQEPNLSHVCGGFKAFLSGSFVFENSKFCILKLKMVFGFKFESPQLAEQLAELSLSLSISTGEIQWRPSFSKSNAFHEKLDRKSITARCKLCSKFECKRVYEPTRLPSKENI